MSGSGLDGILDGIGGAPAAQPTPTSGTPYTEENFPWEEYAEQFNIKPGWSGSAQNNAWEHYLKSGKTWQATPAAPPMTIPPFMPGNQSAIAQQLGMGYGLPASDFMQSPLMQLFQPMTVSPTFTPPKTSSSSKSKSSGKDSISDIVGKWRDED